MSDKVWIVEGRKIGTFVTYGKALEELLAEARVNAGDVPAYLEECDEAEAAYVRGWDIEICDVFTATRETVMA